MNIKETTDLIAKLDDIFINERDDLIQSRYPLYTSINLSEKGRGSAYLTFDPKYEDLYITHHEEDGTAVDTPILETRVINKILALKYLPKFKQKLEEQLAKITPQIAAALNDHNAQCS